MGAFFAQVFDVLLLTVGCRLQNTVIDLEVANHTASPTVDPSVHVFLIGHSMGGIIAAETLLLLASEQPIPPKALMDCSSSEATTSSLEDSAASSRIVEPGSYMFPHVQGIIALDTPFLGIAPGVVSYGAEGQYRTVASAYNAVSDVAGIFGFGKGSGGNDSNTRQQEENTRPSPSSSSVQTSSTADAAATPSWQRWGRYAMFAGAAGALAAGGAAAMYSQRDRLTDGWGWVSSHLVFVGCLARPAELRQRVASLSKVRQERGTRCTNFYTALGKNASSLVETSNQGDSSLSRKIIRSRYRTFCTLPPEEENQNAARSKEPGLGWIKAVNDQSKDEVNAHVSMFTPKANPAFYELVTSASKVLVKSVDQQWYKTATGPVEAVIQKSRENSRNRRDTESPFMGGGDVVLIE